MSNIKKTVLVTLLLITVSVWSIVVAFPDNNLHIVGCDVGQGDAFLIYQGITQILVDTGPGSNLLECLNKNVAFWDRKIDIVIVTHPQKDHYGGLQSVLARYDNQYLIVNGEEGQEEYKDLVDSVQTKVVASSETALKINDLLIDFTWPTKAFALNEQSDPNLTSLVFNLKYKEFSALFTGDIVPQAIGEMLLENEITDVDYLKVPHHGSKNGLNMELLEKANPEVAVISSGNKYGHPHEETLLMLKNKGVKTLRTDQLGDIEVITDGSKWWYNQ